MIYFLVKASCDCFLIAYLVYLNELYFPILLGMSVFIRTSEFILQWCILGKKDWLKSSLSWNPLQGE